MKNEPISLALRQDVYRKIDLFLGANPQKKYVLNVSERKKKRSLPANAAYNSWTPEISNVLALTIPETTRYIKLMFGLPILFSDDYMGSVIWEGLNSKGFFQLSYEDQLIKMDKTYVTRLFDTPMHNRLRDDLQNHFGAMGLNLEYRG